MKPLTPRETQVIDLLCQGKQDKHIAKDLNLSKATVRTYVRRVCDKMGVPNRFIAALEYDRKKR